MNLILPTIVFLGILCALCDYSDAHVSSKSRNLATRRRLVALRRNLARTSLRRRRPSTSSRRTRTRATQISNRRKGGINAATSIRNNKKEDTKHIKQTIIIAKTANIMSPVGTQNNDKTAISNRGSGSVQNSKPPNTINIGAAAMARKRAQRLRQSQRSQRNNRRGSSSSRRPSGLGNPGVGSSGHNNQRHGSSGQGGLTLSIQGNNRGGHGSVQIHDHAGGIPPSVGSMGRQSSGHGQGHFGSGANNHGVSQFAEPIGEHGASFGGHAGPAGSSGGHFGSHGGSMGTLGGPMGSHGTLLNSHGGSMGTQVGHLGDHTSLVGNGNAKSGAFAHPHGTSIGGHGTPGGHGGFNGGHGNTHMGTMGTHGGPNSGHGTFANGNIAHGVAGGGHGISSGGHTGGAHGGQGAFMNGHPSHNNAHIGSSGGHGGTNSGHGVFTNGNTGPNNAHGNHNSGHVGTNGGHMGNMGSHGHGTHGQHGTFGGLSNPHSGHGSINDANGHLGNAGTHGGGSHSSAHNGHLTNGIASQLNLIESLFPGLNTNLGNPDIIALLSSGGQSGTGGGLAALTSNTGSLPDLSGLFRGPEGSRFMSGLIDSIMGNPKSITQSKNAHHSVPTSNKGHKNKAGNVPIVIEAGHKLQLGIRHGPDGSQSIVIGTATVSPVTSAVNTIPAQTAAAMAALAGVELA